MYMRTDGHDEASRRFLRLHMHLMLGSSHKCAYDIISIQYYEHLSVFLPNLPDMQIKPFLCRFILSVACLALL
jgi:putative flippase GtrA